MEYQEPEPVVRNIKAPSDLTVGDYVFASRWSDCDPCDPWAVGVVHDIGRNCVILDSSARAWPHAMRISDEQGRRICELYPIMEKTMRPLDYDVIALVFGVAKDGNPE